ncbi:hypothetical protein ASC90_27095 [Rhizobium sp. Root1220]|nr:hypothetical protein ASC90_27095 [Rhizobium sp. Root1220]
MADRATLRFFAPDGSLLYEFDSRAEWMKVMEPFLEGAQTIHQVHNDEIEVISDTEVRAIWSMEDYLLLAPGNDRPQSIHGFGHYHETWRLLDGSWRLVELELHRTILSVVPRT